jgi:hypothetical protein
MLPAVDFHNEPRTPTFKIDNIRRDGRLSAEVIAKRSQGTKLHPKLYLLWRHRLSENPCSFVGHVTPPGAFT